MIAQYKNWPLALLDRLRLLERQPILYKLRCGVSFLVYGGTNDVQVINGIWIDKIYSPWIGGIQPGWEVVDLGGQRGIFTVYAAKAAKHVYTVEANPEVATFLMTNLLLNDLTDKVSLVQGAISIDEGMVEFFVAKDAGKSSLIKRASVDIEKSISVSRIPVHKFFENLKTVHLLKVDIEGGEFELLTDPRATNWLTKVERIAMEWHGSVVPLYEALNNAGFRVVLWPERKLLYAKHPKVVQ